MIPVTPPPQTQNKMAGIFQYITHLDGTPQEVAQAQAQLAQLTPVTMAVYKTLNILPDGELKRWLTANPVQFWKKVVTLIFGRKYTTGDYRLAERLNDQIYCNGNVDATQTTDEMVDIAHRVFNQLFGVRISTEEDLTALYNGIDAYKARAASQGLSLAAINRAVFLAQNYFPPSTFNKTCWDLSYFEKYPLVDRIPDYELGKWYTGPVVGGANAINGVIQIDANSVLKQYVGASFNPTTGQVTFSGQSLGGIPLDTIAKYAPFIAILIVVGAILSIKLGWYKP